MRGERRFPQNAQVGFVIRVTIVAVSLVSLWAQEGKMAFTRNGDMFIAKEDGSDARKLTQDHLLKRFPHWSTDGKRLLWITPGEQVKNPKTHAKLVIATESGRVLATVPVFASEADGTQIMGMRFVEWFGWYSNKDVYAAGSINPWHSEYRAIEASSGRVIHYFDGSAFSTCPTKSLVADYSYNGVDPPEPENHIEVNENRVYPTATWLAFDDMESEILWSPDCSHLALLRRRAGKSLFLVVIRGDVLEAELEIPEIQQKIKEFVALSDGYVVS